VEDKSYINLGECAFGPEELHVLLKEWLKDPKPKTVNELARMYWAHRWEIQTGFMPYDSRRRYKKGDRIVVRLRGNIEPAEVVGVLENAHYKDGFTCDQIDVRLLSQAARLNGKETKPFIAHDQAQKWADAKVSPFEVITEEDETEVVPKILVAIADDNRFVNFQEYRLPLELLVTEVSRTLSDIRKIIAKCKEALLTREILEKVYAHKNTEELGNVLEFSLDYFLDNDKGKRFECLKDEDSTMRWGLRKPSGPVLVTIDQRTLSNSKLSTTTDLDLLLFYHGFIDQCVFSFPYNRKITAYHDTSEGAICGEEFVNELAKLSENKEYKVRFWHPEQRGDPICVSVPDEPEKIQSTVTIREEWLADGVLKVPKRLSTYMKGTNAVHILYDQVEEELPYDDGDRFIRGLHEFYSKKVIDVFDRVQLQLESLGPTRLFIHSSWKVSLDKLLRIEPRDLDWEQSSLRDCIIVVLAKFRTQAHYREIYTEIGIHKHVSWGAILGTLSRYSPSLFVHVGIGKWGLAGWMKQEEPTKSKATEGEVIIEISNEVWKAIAIIEKDDYVYKLLAKIRKPLSFDEVCEKLAGYLKIDVQELRATGFLKADERLRRLDDGTWALEEWFKPKSLPQGTPSKETSKLGLFWLLVIILLILLFVGGGSMLIWLLIYRS